MDVIKNSWESHYASTKLLRMLEHLDFSVVKEGSRSGYLLSGIHHAINPVLDYSPWILATKHDVEYLFEYVTNHGDVIKLKDLLSPLINNAREDWKKSLVLVTQYGNGDQIHQSARDLDLPFVNIWEI